MRINMDKRVDLDAQDQELLDYMIQQWNRPDLRIQEEPLLTLSILALRIARALEVTAANTGGFAALKQLTTREHPE